jgi:RecJ-like exonuclease
MAREENVMGHAVFVVGVHAGDPDDYRKPCENCSGSGEVGEVECVDCGGTGNDESESMVDMVTLEDATHLVEAERKRWADRLRLLIGRYRQTIGTYEAPSQVINNLEEIIEDLTK